MSTVATILAVLMALVLLALLQRARLVRLHRRAIKALHEAYRRGDYEGQLQAAETFKISEPPACLYFRAQALFELGQMEEAKACLTQCSQMEYDWHKMALYEDALGQALMEEQRYDEATDCFERGIPDWPERGGCHRGIAATLLRQGGRAIEAFGWARVAVNLDEVHSKGTVRVHDLHLGEARVWDLGKSLAILAWAEALSSGNATEVEHLLARAFTFCPETVVPVRSSSTAVWAM